MSFKSLGLGALALALAGCASLNTLNSEVSTYGPWPAARKPASFAFERLPSQAEHPEHQQQLEDAARGAVEAAGFRAAPDMASAEYLMQVGARVSSNDPWVYNDPLFWRGAWRYGYGPGRWRYGPGPFFPGYGFGGWGYPGPASFEREVALLIRDRQTGQLLYEARAHNEGPSPSIDALMPAMFAAAMKDFPGTGPNPRPVTTQISRE
jgi:hypothetical protein